MRLRLLAALPSIPVGIAVASTVASASPSATGANYTCARGKLRLRVPPGSGGIWLTFARDR